MVEWHRGRVRVKGVTITRAGERALGKLTSEWLTASQLNETDQTLTALAARGLCETEAGPRRYRAKAEDLDETG